MLPAERKRRIVELVSADDGRSVEGLADELGYSKATIRRDLRELEDRGLIERSHGGAVPVTTVGKEQTYGQKEVQNIDGKRSIAERAVEEITPGQVVFFDAGTTTMEVAKQAPTDGSVLSVTNSPRLAVELGKEENDVKLTGGTLRSRTRALVGPTAESFMERTNFDLLFLGTNAIDADGGLTTPNEDEARMKELMTEKAARVVLVADATKVGKRSFVKFADLGDVDVFVTDAELPQRERQAFENEGVSVVAAPPE
ncbi:transcriptional regulator, deor family protein [Halogeometricum borinquense DSM 11551]|uniref:Transcriptional regulator, DeoR family n=2 Tax=Halogeometricum borinquense TaxID=60847 RepID=E4NMA0_HALBP|nr:HTH-type transcriptional regulator GlpR [Halogeometricum borinquense]ADQ67305.1 transcriptional regulator, DeoR family [Halogeometricum borinquense DSM 11551]ELY28520.1 transcriptional regulator, deor family protein [Halogeometricum borinquense DSM 11551]RYJ13682.1 DeoR/GlpR transcriptional regulator [Halogeometricum borinquense]